ncbi:MAG: fructosamine kinase family protein [Mariprofundus sp.]
MLYDDLERLVRDATGTAFQVEKITPITGGSINAAFCLDGRVASQPVRYFLKCNQADRLTMFEAEADALREIAGAAAIQAPLPVAHGICAAEATLVLEYIELSGQQPASSSTLLGHQLAAMHRHVANQFGWFRDNTIGSTPQRNQQNCSWTEFYRDQRLGVQLNLATQHGFGASLLDKGMRLQADMEHFFTSYKPQPSLLHGDLWGGNYGMDEHGQPVLFDPATYYGDREADIAMTELFGGFDAGFYDAYREAWPLDDDYSERKGLYNLYHILNHANLFGGGYARQAESLLDQLLAEVA